MSILNQEKLITILLPGATDCEPIVPRCYTLTHFESIDELALSIGFYYDYEKIGDLRDEVLGKWIYSNKNYTLNIYLYVNGKESIIDAKIRDSFFRKQLGLALAAIRYGDRKFFECHEFLDKAPIIVHFNSNYEKYNKIERWGVVGDYK